MSAIVKKAIASRGWTQKRLAIEAGVHTSVISRYVKYGVFPRMETVVKIAEALDLNPMELLEEALRKGETL